MTARFEDAQKGVAQIYAADGRVVGTGFLIAPGYVLTCAHVVRVAWGGDPDDGAIIQVLLFEEDAPRAAQVLFYDFDADDYGADAALLRLEATNLPQLSIFPVARLQQLDDDAPLKAFGFPDPGGRILTTKTKGRIQGNWIQIEDSKLTGVDILGGFSGAPVWCQTTGAWVGMIVARSDLGVNDKVGFMLPYENLSTVLLEPRRAELQAMLAPEGAAIWPQVLAAYEVVRPQKRGVAVMPKTLDVLLSELNLAAAGGKLESRLVQFAVCLFLEELLKQPLRQCLKDWIEAFSSTELQQLCEQAREQCNQHRGQNEQPLVNPCLWIRIQANKVSGGEPYQVDGRFVPDPEHYAETGQGARTLSTEKWQSYMVDDVEETKPSGGWTYAHLPALIAAFFDQVGDAQVALTDLTIELFVPLSLMNKGFELLSILPEGGLGFPENLGITAERPQVILRSQKRLEMKRTKGLWREKWKQLDPGQGSQSAQSAFVSSSDNLRQLQTDLKTGFGLKLEHSPQTTNQGELALVLATGTPAALWVRCDASDTAWAGQLDHQILSGALPQVPENVATVRRAAPYLDDAANCADSLELGHRLALLWENPDNVPSPINYSDEML